MGNQDLPSVGGEDDIWKLLFTARLAKIWVCILQNWKQIYLDWNGYIEFLSMTFMAMDEHLWFHSNLCCFSFGLDLLLWMPWLQVPCLATTCWAWPCRPGFSWNECETWGNENRSPNLIWQQVRKWFLRNLPEKTHFNHRSIWMFLKIGVPPNHPF